MLHEEISSSCLQKKNCCGSFSASFEAAGSNLSGRSAAPPGACRLTAPRAQLNKSTLPWDQSNSHSTVSSTIEFNIPSFWSTSDASIIVAGFKIETVVLKLKLSLAVQDKNVEMVLTPSAQGLHQNYNHANLHVSVLQHLLGSEVNPPLIADCYTNTWIIAGPREDGTLPLEGGEGYTDAFKHRICYFLKRPLPCALSKLNAGACTRTSVVSVCF